MIIIKSVLFLFISCCTVAAANQDALNFTPLHDAVIAGRISNVKEILSLDKTAIDMKEEYGYTPLHYAVKLNYKDIAEYLINNQASIQTYNKFNDMPIIDAVRNDNIEIVKLLVCSGASRSVKDKNGFSLYSYASLNGNKQMLELLKEQDLSVLCTKEAEVKDEDEIAADELWAQREEDSRVEKEFDTQEQSFQDDEVLETSETMEAVEEDVEAVPAEDDVVTEEEKSETMDLDKLLELKYEEEFK